MGLGQFVKDEWSGKNAKRRAKKAQDRADSFVKAGKRWKKARYLSSKARVLRRSGNRYYEAAGQRVRDRYKDQKGEIKAAIHSQELALEKMKRKGASYEDIAKAKSDLRHSKNQLSDLKADFHTNKHRMHLKEIKEMNREHRARKREERRSAREERRFKRDVNKYGVTRASAILSEFKKPISLIGLHGAPKREAKAYNKKLALSRKMNIDTMNRIGEKVGKLKEHVSRNKGKYAAAAAGVLGLGALGAMNSYNRKVIRDIHRANDRRAANNAAMIASVAGALKGGSSGSVAGNLAKIASSSPIASQIAMKAAGKLLK